MRIQPGLTLIEVVLAIMIFSIGGLGLAAGAAATAKQISSNTLRSRAAAIALSRAEQAQSGDCTAISSGEARSSGIHAVWSVNGGAVPSLDQHLNRFDSHGVHADRFLSAIPCD